MNTHETNSPAQNPPPETASPATPSAYPATYPPPPAVGQLPAHAPAPQRRSPGLAVVLSFLPGLGHLYLGLYARAIAVLLSFVVAINLANVGAFGIFVAFVWFFGLIDSYRQAQLINAGELPDAGKDAALKAVGRGNLGFGIFLLLAGIVLLVDRIYGIDWYFLQDWYPVAIILAGIYLVVRAILDAQKRKAKKAAAEDSEI